MENNIAILEGLLFLCGDEGIIKENICLVLGMNNENVIELLGEYKNKLKDESRGLELVKFGEHYKLTTKAMYHEYYSRLVDNPTNFSFSNAALETLAIIAYNQPITRGDVERIRGVGSDNMIRKLLSRSLIKEAGFKESPGRPKLYQVTNDFLDIFNLKSLEELPILKDVNLSEEEQDIFKTRFIEEQE
ncbi:MAG: SMC-Scp complex subunit ScpB [Erysipelotrichales bacterium]